MKQNKPALLKSVLLKCISIVFITMLHSFTCGKVTVGSIKNESTRNLDVRLDERDSYPAEDFLNAGQHFYIHPNTSVALYLPYILNRPKHHLYHLDFYDADTIHAFFISRRMV